MPTRLDFSKPSRASSRVFGIRSKVVCVRGTVRSRGLDTLPKLIVSVVSLQEHTIYAAWNGDVAYECMSGCCVRDYVS
ncbi:nuclear transcriptional regulator 1-like protein [Anopheles sinensis]|uniref:Nuclear transcriptional regulator 1-like protein n=1 Tax=Anopheles sinensis TaxID=74873 RepID=A0A084WP92_ANOSI|nr:nuclear transcriptional regulator 1-like protein [Anopheles sinensis]